MPATLDTVEALCKRWASLPHAVLLCLLPTESFKPTAFQAAHVGGLPARSALLRALVGPKACISAFVALC